MAEADNTQQRQEFKHIIRIANVDLSGGKKIRWALTNIKGIGVNFADALCVLAKVNKDSKTGYLSPEEISRLNQIVADPLKAGMPVWMLNRRKDFESAENKHLLTGTLLFYQDNDIKRLKKIKTYKGVRHILGLPVRGQRTRSNFRKMKGKVVGVAKKKAAGSPAEKEKK